VPSDARPDDGAVQPRSLNRAADARPDDGAVQPRSLDRAATPRPASTIILLRDGADGLEVFMVVRHHAIDFAGGALVFPGGRVEEADAALGEAFRIAAIREAFEESGILLARRGDVWLAEHSLPRDGDFHALLAEQALEPAIDALVHFAHWITPEDMPKRFDTHFFAAHAPAQQVGRHDGGEAVESLWINPAQAVAQADAGQRMLVFATRMNLLKLARFTHAAQALAECGPVVTVRPEPFTDEHGRWIRIPEEAGYGGSVFKGAVRPMKPLSS